MAEFFEAVKKSHRPVAIRFGIRVARLEAFDDRIDAIHVEHYTEQTQIRKQREPNISRAERRTIERLRKLFLNFVIRPADKNLGTTVLLLETWNQDVMKALTSAEFFEQVLTNDSRRLKQQLTDRALIDFDLLTLRRMSIFADARLARRKMAKKSELKKIGTLAAMPKLHKGIKEGGHVDVRCVVSHCSSIIGPVSRANAELYRLARYKIELAQEFEPRVMHDVTDFIAEIIAINADIKVLCEAGVVDIGDLKIITADMKNMYPATRREKIVSNVRALRDIVVMAMTKLQNDAAFDFMEEAVDF